MWTRTTKKEFMSCYRSLARRRGEPRLTELHVGGVTVQVWSHGGRNVLRRDASWRSTDGGEMSTCVYFVSDQFAGLRLRGMRRPECADCCGACCRDPFTLLPLNPGEVAEVRLGKLDWPVRRVGWEYYLERGDDGKCVFLSDGGRCKIYKRRRPLACRAWFCGRGTEHDEDWRKISNNLKWSAANARGRAA
jgi:Fe-S-cluster containining protein